MTKVNKNTSLGLGVFEVDEKVFFFKRSASNNVFTVDYSRNGYEFETFCDTATITNNKKLIDIGEIDGFRVTKLEERYFLTYLKKAGDEKTLFSPFFPMKDIQILISGRSNIMQS